MRGFMKQLRGLFNSQAEIDEANNATKRARENIAQIDAKINGDWLLRFQKCGEEFDDCMIKGGAENVG